MNKRIFYLAVTLMHFSTNAFSQQKVIDSLYEIVGETSVSDSLHINALNKLATKIGNIDTKKSDSLFQQAISLARQSKNVAGEVRALMALSFLKREITSFTAARQLLL